MYYKNVDIADIENILEKGVLSMDESGNDNWDEGRRADNATDVVYLFKPKKRNCLNMYGLLLLEISENIDAVKVEFSVGDNNAQNYDEYVVDRVSPGEILHIYAPRFLRNRMLNCFSADAAKRITWVEFKAYRYESDEGKVEIYDHRGYGYKECSDYEYSLRLNDK